MSKESPMKIGLIGIGITSFVAAWAWSVFKPPSAPTAFGASGGADIVAMITQLIGVVTLLLGAFADIKKAIPPEAIADIERMVKEKKLDISVIAALISGKYKIDFGEIIEIVKQTIEKMKDLGGDDKVPDKIPDDKMAPPIVSDDQHINQMLSEMLKMRTRPLQINMRHGDKDLLAIDVKSCE